MSAQSLEPPPATSNWPTVIGILEIVLGALGILMYACGGCANVVMPIIMQQVDDNGDIPIDPMTQAQLDVNMQYVWWNVLNSVVLLALGVLVLFAGIKLVRRHAASMKLSRFWAIGRILWTIPGTVMGVIYSRAIMDEMKKAAELSDEQSVPTGFLDIVASMGVVGAIVTAIFVLAMPVFVLIWFARRPIQDEVQSWTGAGGSVP